jgi:hypothetical protein
MKERNGAHAGVGYQRRPGEASVAISKGCVKFRSSGRRKALGRV